MALAQTLKEVLQALDEAKIPEDLREVAFAKSLEHLLGGAAAVTAPATPVGAGAPARGVVVGAPGDNPASRIAAALGLSSAVVETVVHVEDDEAHVLVAASRFDSKRTKATEQIAVLVAAARQFSGLDEDGWTSTEKIRAVVEHFGKLDQSNFAGTIKNMHDVFLIRGEGRSRKVKLNAPGKQRATALISDLSSAS
jgi:hypothetical protein